MKRIYAREDYCIGCRLCEINCLLRTVRAGCGSRTPGPPGSSPAGEDGEDRKSEWSYPKHSKSMRIIKAFRRERDTVTSAVRVEEMGLVSFALQCRHCDDAPCIEACITGAMQRDPDTGVVICDQDRCVGCWSCIMVCRAGAVLRGKTHRVASKCDLCAGEKAPVCVEGCPNEALVYEER